MSDTAISFMALILAAISLTVSLFAEIERKQREVRNSKFGALVTIYAALNNLDKLREELKSRASSVTAERTPHAEGVATKNGKANPRFLVTSLHWTDGDARKLYEDVYCARRDGEPHQEMSIGLHRHLTIHPNPASKMIGPLNRSLYHVGGGRGNSKPREWNRTCSRGKIVRQRFIGSKTDDAAFGRQSFRAVFDHDRTPAVSCLGLCFCPHL